MTIENMGLIEKFRFRLSYDRFSNFFPRFPIPVLKTNLFKNDSQVLVSVVIPNYGYDLYIQNVIRLILRSSLTSIEVILVDSRLPNSKTTVFDSLGEVIKDHRVRVVEKGPGKAGENRNFGIALARGAYVMCIDPDDWMSPYYLEAILFFALRRGLDVAGAGMYVFENETKRWHVPSRVYVTMLERANAVPTNALFLRNMWAKAGGIIDYNGIGHIHEDWRFWHQLALVGARIESLDFPLTCIRIHSDSLSRGSDVLSDEENREFIKTSNRELLKNRTKSSFFRRVTRKCRSVKAIVHEQLEVLNSHEIYDLMIITNSSDEVIELVSQIKMNDVSQRILVVNHGKHPNIVSYPDSALRIYNLRDLMPRSEWNSFTKYLIERYRVLRITRNINLA